MVELYAVGMANESNHKNKQEANKCNYRRSIVYTVTSWNTVTYRNRHHSSTHRFQLHPTLETRQHKHGLH
jgi:hypothetical protein